MGSRDLLRFARHDPGVEWREGDDPAEAICAALDRIREDRDRWREECWQILLATGADPDGDDARHLNPGEALRAVEELRRECDLAYQSASEMESDDCSEADALARWAERGADDRG